ncbi:unnamed protein product [Colias eurytheme]|nr:unnamed protein product [Colias eurytheme]
MVQGQNRSYIRGSKIDNKIDDLGTLRRDMTEMFRNLKSEISDLMNSFKSQQDKKLSLIQASVDYLTTNLAKLKQSVEFFSEKYDEIHNKIGVLEQI